MTTKSYVLKLPEDLHRAIKTTASAEGRTIKDMILDMLRKRFGGTRISPDDPLLKALHDAPLDDEPLTDEEREGLREARDDAKAGRVDDWEAIKKKRAGR
ncbi:MAG TPA: hypothetical protein PLP29_19055 [Candidatus Ozemobacteraceae bacterium]|nr:hypothetical protein [Candidatus Ozemobacteraceae bacterium]